MSDQHSGALESTAPVEADGGAVRRWLQRAPGRLLAIALAILLYVEIPDLLFAGSGLLVLSSLALLHAWLVDGRIDVLGLKRPVEAKHALVLGVLAALLMWGTMKLGLGPAIDHLTGHHRDLSRLDVLRGNTRAVVGMLLLVWATAAFGEELLFRGFVLGQLERGFGDGRRVRVVAALLSSALFGLAHIYQGISGVLLTGIGGLGFATLFLLNRRSLWANIVAHGCFDTISVLLAYWSLDKPLAEWMSRWL